MALELIPFPISVLFAMVFVFAWVAILWKIHRRAKIYAMLFYVSLLAGIVILLALFFSALGI